MILEGVNDLPTLFPSLAEEWSKERNGNLVFSELKPHYKKSVWWKCPNGHEYRSRIAVRLSGIGCPYCANRKKLRTLQRDKQKI